MLRRYSTLGTFTLVFAVTGTVATSCGPYSTSCDDGIGCVTGGGSGNAGVATGGKSAAGSAGKSTAQGGSSTGGSESMAGASNISVAGAGGAAGGAEGGAGGVAVSLPCDGACKAPTPVCDEPNNACVECLKEADCAAGAKKKCDTAKSCVECLAPADCTSATAAKCDSTGACVKCTTNDDCAHIAGKGVCDTKAGECVQCTAADESACAGKSCNPATRACTNTTVGTADYCQPCVADSECIGGNKADPDTRCVPMEFKSVPRTGGFCTKRVSKGCAAPFTVTFASTSLSAAKSESYCGIDQANVTCEAVLDLVAGSSCSPDGADTACGCPRGAGPASACTAPGKGGLCRAVGGVVESCTYACGTTSQCPTGTTCTGGQPYCH